MGNRISASISEFNSLSLSKKIIIGLILVILLIGGFLLPNLISNYSSSVKPIPTLSEISPTPTIVKPIPASLTLSSDTTTYKVGDTITVSLNLDSGTYGVGAADFVIHFDPKILKPTLITPGNYFKVFANKMIEKDFIKISAIAEVTNTGINFPKGKGSVATINFTVLSSTAQTGITFDTQKTIVASDGKNILDKTQELTLTITQ